MLNSQNLPRLSSVMYIMGKFDQCVLGQGAGWQNRLFDLQSTLYAEWSEFKRLCNPEFVKLLLVNEAVEKRLNAYHRMIAGDNNALVDLLAIICPAIPTDERSVYNEVLKRRGKR